MHCSLLTMLFWTLSLMLRLCPPTLQDPTVVNTPQTLDTIRFSNPYPTAGSLDIMAAGGKISHLWLCSARKVLLSWLILFSGDVEINPGPIKYPCGECSAPVKSNQYGIQCDVCTNWLHTIYIGLSDDQYAELQQSTDPWSCRNCLRQALPFHNRFLTSGYAVHTKCYCRG